MELKLDGSEPYFQYFTLLIVPYGIETTVKVPLSSTAPAFNRTLWN